MKIEATRAKRATIVKIHWEIDSGLSSATYGAKIVMNLAGTLQIANAVATTDTGNKYEFPQ